MLRISLLILFLWSSSAVFVRAQAQDKKLIQFSGLVTTRDSNAVPYVTITNKSAGNQIHVANYKGYFSFLVHEADTLVFSAVGYHSTEIVIPNKLADQRYTKLVSMTQLVINLPVVRIYPWYDVEEFKREFMDLQVADGDLEIAKKNLTRDKSSESYIVLTRDGQEMRGFDFQANHNNLSNQNINQQYANPLFNPFIWKSLLKQIFRREAANQDQRTVPEQMELNPTNN